MNGSSSSTEHIIIRSKSVVFTRAVRDENGNSRYPFRGHIAEGLCPGNMESKSVPRLGTV